MTCQERPIVQIKEIECPEWAPRCVNSLLCTSLPHVSGVFFMWARERTACIIVGSSYESHSAAALGRVVVFWHVTEQHVVDMLHMLAYAQPGGSGCGGGLIMCLTTLRQGPRNLLPFLTTLWDVRKKKWMSQWRIALETWKAALEDQNWLTAQAKPTFLNLSHTPANRNGYPCCKHFWTSPTNTSFLPLSLENLNFKFVTVTRAASQPVASGFSKFRGCRIQDSHAQWFYVILIYARPLIHRMYIYVFICICLYIYVCTIV